MSSAEQPTGQPPTNEELLANAERFAGYARNLYGKEDKLADTAALVSLAGSALVIARSLATQTALMEEVHLAEPPVHRSDDLTGAGGDAL